MAKKTPDPFAHQQSRKGASRSTVSFKGERPTYTPKKRGK